MHFNLLASLPTSTKSFNTKLSYVKPLTTAAVAIIALGTITSAHAKILFTDTSITGLYGDNFKLTPNLDDNALKVMTLEHASTHTWGGVFFFVDRIQGDEYVSNPKTGETKKFKETYGELAPKLKIATFDTGLIKQVNLAGQYEFGSNGKGFSQDNYLVGVGADLNLPIPNMKYASASIYHAFNSKENADDQQITLTYGWEKNNFVIDGYIDYSFNSEDDSVKDNIHINPQIKYNLQKVLGIDNRLEVGMEYSYWKNKFGSNETQSAPSALVKFHF